MIGTITFRIGTEGFAAGCDLERLKEDDNAFFVNVGDLEMADGWESDQHWKVQDDDDDNDNNNNNNNNHHRNNHKKKKRKKTNNILVKKQKNNNNNNKSSPQAISQ